MKPIINASIALIGILSVYFLIVSLVSGFAFATDQFAQFWSYLIALAIGFAIQIGLYTYLRQSIDNMSKGAVATTGTTSTLAMISCCAHYLANLLPALGIGALATLIAQYQIKLFWVGIIINIGGILFMIHRIEKHKKLKIIN